VTSPPLDVPFSAEKSMLLFATIAAAPAPAKTSNRDAAAIVRWRSTRVSVQPLFAIVTLQFVSLR